MRTRYCFLALFLLLSANLRSQTVGEVRQGLEIGLEFFLDLEESPHIFVSENLQCFISQLPTQWRGHQLAYHPEDKAKSLCRRGIRKAYYLYCKQRGGDTVEVAMARWKMEMQGRSLRIMVEAEGPFVWFYGNGEGERASKTWREWQQETHHRFEENVREGFIKGFYAKYLSLTCNSKAFAWESADSLIRANYSDSLLAAYDASREPETDDFLDYDILIQGQDCMPGVKVESVNAVGSTFWMKATMLSPSFEEGGSPTRQCVYFYVDRFEGKLKIAAIRDQYTQLGTISEPFPDNLYFK